MMVPIIQRVKKLFKNFGTTVMTDRKKAAAISGDYLKRRKAELSQGLHNPKTAGKP